MQHLFPENMGPWPAGAKIEKLQCYVGTTGCVFSETYQASSIKPTTYFLTSTDLSLWKAIISCNLRKQITADSPKL